MVLMFGADKQAFEHLDLVVITLFLFNVDCLPTAVYLDFTETSIESEKNLNF